MCECVSSLASFAMLARIRAASIPRFARIRNWTRSAACQSQQLLPAPSSASAAGGHELTRQVRGPQRPPLRAGGRWRELPGIVGGDAALPARSGQTPPLGLGCSAGAGSPSRSPETHIAARRTRARRGDGCRCRRKPAMVDPGSGRSGLAGHAGPR